jgi:hypothetical protein
VNTIVTSIVVDSTTLLDRLGPRRILGTEQLRAATSDASQLASGTSTVNIEDATGTGACLVANFVHGEGSVYFSEGAKKLGNPR